MDAISQAIMHRKGRKSLRMLAAELGLPESSAALLSKALRGLPISADSERTIGRALGVIPPARNVRRVSVAAIPLAEIRQLAEAAGSQIVLAWCERIGR